MTLHPDEQARELRERLDQFIDREGEWDTKDAADKEIAAAFARVRLETARKLEGMPCGEYDDGSRAAYIAELERQAAGERAP